ncbi:peptidoglycan DD-metalloendopeptidase family protein [Piscibacillus salipiscarius]|uniref:Peptidoglycan DD-metalloendopeptidase family protein n=3 Tax=Piscibacillus salipiscarius TaxID=299480 RepID=A0ABW5Q9D4_9BACI
MIQKANENERLQSRVNELNQQLNTQQLTFEKDRRDIERQLAELRSIEEQMIELINQLNVDRAASLSSNNVPDKVGLVKSSELKINRPYSAIKQEVSGLVASYQMAVSQLEEVNRDLKKTPIHWPAASETVSSHFGYRTDPFTNTGSFHSGIDLAGPLGTDIYVAGDGIIEFAGYQGAYGYSILVDHGNSYKTRYSHLNEVKVKKGESVTQGQLIGSMGTTGRSTGVHLHYEVIKNGKHIDPFPLMTFLQNAFNE